MNRITEGMDYIHCDPPREPNPLTRDHRMLLGDIIAIARGDLRGLMRQRKLPKAGQRMALNKCLETALDCLMMAEHILYKDGVNRWAETAINAGEED